MDEADSSWKEALVGSSSEIDTTDKVPTRRLAILE